MPDTATPPRAAADFVDALNHEYEALHVAKEDAFWTAYMGLSADASAARADLDRKEIAIQRFLQDPARLARVREVQAAASAGPATGADTLTALTGWRATFDAHVIDEPGARALAEEIVQAEGELAQAPAFSAICACSTVVTSMMTPPLSISARPVLRRSAVAGGL